jgi:hypothetical protein
VLLDLKRNKYLGLSGADANALARRVVDLPKCDETSSAVDDGAIAELFEEMSSAGMLCRSAEQGAFYPSFAVAAPAAALIDGYSDVTTRIAARELACFVTAALSAKWLLRSFSLERIARRIRARRLRRQSDAPPDIERLRCLVAGFAKMRTFAFTASNECLFDSLVLSEFLSRYWIFPHWVFGVTTNPFAAHCWLQQGSVVINDSPEHVRRFSPIMSI